MAIRNFEYEDLEEVAKIADESLQENYSIDFLLYLWQINPEGFMVAERDGKVVGFIVSIKEGKEKLRILMLAVDKKFRRKGIGKSLLRELLIKYPETRKVVLEVRSDNKEAINFYKKQKFKIKGKIEDFYTDGSTAYLMERVLF
ncbi:MAG TPA: N-acetyltransferase [Thermoplasmatales archaeon]|nr:N-acetyltransferase [Thermoplasmatales archaeon]